MNASRPPSSRRELLRDATRRHHADLDTIAGRLDLTQVADYGRFLIANAGPLAALECALESEDVGALLTDWSTRVRRHAIAADLAVMRLTVSPVLAPRMDSRSARFGTLYVLEGSRLGAQVSFRQASATIEPLIQSATRFLRAHDPAHWPSFLHVLESADDIDVADLLAGACRAFELFQASFAAVTHALRKESSDVA